MGGTKRSVFDAVETLEAQDALKTKKQRKARKRDVARSLATRKQDDIYRRALECRILLQRPLAQAKKIDSEDAIGICNKILVNLLQARQKLRQVSPPSAEYQTVVNVPLQLETTLQVEYKAMESEWKATLDKRHKELQLHSGHSNNTSFRIMDSSFWEQVTSTAEHEIMHKKDAPFDDSKVYQLMLKEFLSSKTTETGSILPQKTQNVKKQVDRKASKGRKIRYNISPKLVNFTFPLSRPQGELEVDAYFSSLFGGVARKYIN